MTKVDKCTQIYINLYDTNENDMDDMNKKVKIIIHSTRSKTKLIQTQTQTDLTIIPDTHSLTPTAPSNTSNFNIDVIKSIDKDMNKDKTNIIVYVLECSDGKYYVGRTNDFSKRLDMHLNGSGSFWTRRYPMVRVIDINWNADKFDEDKYVIKYMDKYGIDNVRGGSYSQMILNEDLKKTINRYLVTANNLCYICNLDGHLIRECPQNPKNPKIFNERKRKIENESENDCEPSKKKLKLDYSQHNNHTCDRCGRTGHYNEQCFAKKHFNGYTL
jgi:hypothetical protein